MLTVIARHSNSDFGRIIQEGKKNRIGGKYTRHSIEKVAKLPSGYNVGTKTVTEKFDYEVIKK